MDILKDEGGQVELDNGNISTAIISIVTLVAGALLSYFLANPTALEDIFVQLGVEGKIIAIVVPMLLVVIAVVYNAYFPRQTTETKDEQA